MAHDAPSRLAAGAAFPLYRAMRETMAKISEMDEKQLVAFLDKVFFKYKGATNDIEGAIGALMIGRHLGWKPLFLMHDKKKIKKYEQILGVEFRDALDETGKRADKSIAWKLVKNVSNFWKAVTGNIPNVRSGEIS